MAMSARKRKAASSSSASQTKQSQKQVTKETFQKWQRGIISPWRGYVLRWTITRSRRCLHCGALFVGSTRAEYAGSNTFPGPGSMVQLSNHKTSNITDHTSSEPHKVAIVYFRRDQARSRNEPVTSYSPIARSLLSSSMDPAVRERIKKKFDISFVLAKER